MAYTISVLIHRAGYAPATPQTVYETATQPVETGAALRRTIIHHDDGDPVPAGTEDEIERYTLPVSADTANRNAILRQLTDDVDLIVARRAAWSGLTAQQKQAQIVTDWPNLLAFLERITRILARRLESSS